MKIGVHAMRTGTLPALHCVRSLPEGSDDDKGHKVGEHDHNPTEDGQPPWAKPLVERLPGLDLSKGRARSCKPVANYRHQERVHRVGVHEDVDERCDRDLAVYVRHSHLHENRGDVQADWVHDCKERSRRDHAHFPLGWWPERRMSAGRKERITAGTRIEHQRLNKIQGQR